MRQRKVLVLMFFLALVLPLTSYLGQQNQENRSLAYAQLGQSCKLTSACQPPLICSGGVCKNGAIRTGNKGLNQGCNSESDCRSPYVCYSDVCKVRSGGECSRSSDCYANHYCSRSNNHCRKKDSYNLGDYSVEGVSVSSMLGGGSGGQTNTPTNPPASTVIPTTAPTRAPTRAPTQVPTRAPTQVPTRALTQAPTRAPTRTTTVIPIETIALSITDIVVTPNPLSLTVGESLKLTTKTIPEGKTVSYLWESNNANIASVDINGLVTANKEGEATITAKVKGTNIFTNIKAVVSKIFETNISFKIAFDGILPGSNCIDQFLVDKTKLMLSIENVPTNKYEDNIEATFEETNEVDTKGNRVFKVTNLRLDSNKYSMVNNFNYIKVKGPWHLRRKMCLDGQTEKMAESVVCDIDLKSNKTYDFSEYTLLSGDVSVDGAVNTVDLGYIKSRLNSGSEIKCGIEGDLNMDGVVNTLDLNLVKKTLTERDDE